MVTLALDAAVTCAVLSVEAKTMLGKAINKASSHPLVCLTFCCGSEFVLLMHAHVRVYELCIYMRVLDDGVLERGGCQSRRPYPPLRRHPEP